MEKSPITTHVLDTSAGRPAAGIGIELYRQEGDGSWRRIGEGTTNSDGRAFELLPPGTLTEGNYRLTFDIAAYFARQQLTSFYPSVSIDFRVHAPSEHYHVPLLLSPFGYSTYRGS